MSDATEDYGEFVFDLTGDASFLRKFGNDELEKLKQCIEGMIDGRALDRHFSKRVKDELSLFWSGADLDFYGATAVVFPHRDYFEFVEPRKFDFYETFVSGLESTAAKDLPDTEALLLKCLGAVRAEMAKGKE